MKRPHILRCSRRTLWTAGLTGTGFTIAFLFLKPLLILPPLDQANAQDLMRWVALRDLSTYPRSFQESFVDRLQETLRPRDLPASTSLQSPFLARYAQRIRANAELLKRVWFEIRCARYQACSDASRAAYLQDQLRTIFEWADYLRQQSSTDVPEAADPVKNLVRQIEAWIAESSGSLRSSMQATVRDAVICYLATHDLAAETPATRRAIAEEIHRQLTSSQSSVDLAPLPLDAQQQHRLGENAWLLIEAWMRGQAEAYAAAAPNDRGRMIEQVLDDLETMHLEQYLGMEQGSGGSALTAAAERVPRWLESVEGEERVRLAAFLRHLQGAALLRSVRSWWPGGTEKPRPALPPP